MADHGRSRRVRLAVAALAVPGLVLAGAAPTLAAGEKFTNDDLPGKVSLAKGESATVELTTPDGFDCSTWIVRKVGQKRGNVLVTSPASFEGCSNATVLTYTVAVPSEYTKKANVVLKFKVYNADGTANVVETLVVKVNKTKPDTGKPSATPSKSPNPSKSPKPGKGNEG